METSHQYLIVGSAIVSLPVLFIFIYFKKYLVRGLTAGSVKE
jgi:ABC-type glycerol-3-phosphate transport system permease component